MVLSKNVIEGMTDRAYEEENTVSPAIICLDCVTHNTCDAYL